MILSLYSESIIGKDDNRQRELKPLLIKAAQFFDSVFESKDRPQRNQDFLVHPIPAFVKKIIAMLGYSTRVGGICQQRPLDSTGLFYVLKSFLFQRHRTMVYYY